MGKVVAEAVVLIGTQRIREEGVSHRVGVRRVKLKHLTLVSGETGELDLLRVPELFRAAEENFALAHCGVVAQAVALEIGEARVKRKAAGERAGVIAGAGLPITEGAD